MVIDPFTFSNVPSILFGIGQFQKLPETIRSYGTKALIISGRTSFSDTPRAEMLFSTLSKQDVAFWHCSTSGEPSVEQVDNIVSEHADKHIDAVVSIGGGSVIDTGKAVSAMLGKNESVQHYLEAVGDRLHDGSKIPFIAVPTTAGTGSETTKNAVISKIAPEGFKKSLRHNNFVPDVALIDPELTLSCPPAVTAACGMDAFVQLLESYVSDKASPMTDALALSGIRAMKDALFKAYTNGADDIDARTAMAYAACVSGITLTNAGLGVVHGLASPIGGFFDIPHGVICGVLIGPATQLTICKATAKNNPALEKYAQIGRLLTGNENLDTDASCRSLVETIHCRTRQLKLPRLGELGIQTKDLDKIIAATGSKNNPVKLTSDELKQLLLESI